MGSNDVLSADEQQRRSFALGNTRIGNDMVTSERVDRAADGLATAAPPALHVFFADAGDGEWVIAASRADASEVYRTAKGADYVLDEEDPKLADWHALPDDDVRPIKNDDTGERERKTCAEWIAAQGRGFLCTGNL